MILVAGAGFGKTTALEEALQARGGSRAWVSCSHTGGDPGRLLVELLEALQRSVPGAADVLNERLAAAPEPIDVVAAARVLVRELERLLVEPLVLVLDDAEALERERGALELVSACLQSDADRLRLALASRRGLPLRLAKLRTAGRIAEYGEADLAFSAPECAELLRARLGHEPAPEVVEALMQQTEGWPLALALGAMAAPGEELSAQRSRGALFAFLAEEVLGGLEPALREAMLDSSIALELNAPVAAALELPERFLQEVERRGLFLRPVGTGRRRFSFHPLFRSFLHQRFEQERGESVRRRLHGRLARALATERPAEAIEHLLEADEDQAALEAMARQAPQLLNTAPDSLRRFHERLPRKLREHPAASLLEGRLEMAAGHPERALRPLRAAAAGFRARDDAAGEWAARFPLADGLYFLGGCEDVVDLAGGFDAPEAEGAGPAAPAVAMLAACRLADDGREEESEALARRALAHPQGAPLAVLDCGRRAYIDWPAGRGEQSVKVFKAAARELERADPLNLRGPMSAAIGLVTMEQGRHQEALEAFQRAIDLHDLSGVGTDVPVQSRTFRALIMARRGELARAEAELEQAPSSPVGYRAYVLSATRAYIAWLRSDRAEALAAAERALQEVGPGPLLDRLRAATLLVPLLAEAGERDRAGALLRQALALCQEAFPGPRGHLLRGGLLALRAWLCHTEGDEHGADAFLDRCFEEAGEAASHVLRREWARLEPLLWGALERGALSPATAVEAIAGADPGGAALAALTEHPLPAVRRAALGPAAASGHPEALARLRPLGEDPEPSVAASARAAAERLRLAPPPLSLKLLGGLEVRRGAFRLDSGTWGRPAAARLVRFLLVRRPTAVSEDVIFEALWPGRAPGSARNALHMASSRARAVLDLPGAGRSALELEGRSYRLRLSEHDSVDVDEFEAATAGALGERGPARRELLERAAALWGGEPLPEERYEDWSRAWRERLTDRYGELLFALIECCSRSGDHAAAVEAGRRLVALDQLDEAAQRDLMRAYARAGRRAHALRQYLECRRALVDALGVEPAAATAGLHGRILAGERV